MTAINARELNENDMEMTNGGLVWIPTIENRKAAALTDSGNILYGASKEYSVSIIKTPDFMRRTAGITHFRF